MSEERKSDEQTEESPAQKLQHEPPPGPLSTPGTEKAESEVQNEKSMNTE